MSSTTSPVPHLPQNQRAPREIENHLATGELRRVRRGTYIPAAPDAPGFTSRRATREILLRAVRNERLDGVVDLGGLRVTSLERTAEDCARFLPPDRALTVVDSLFAIAAGAGERPWDRREKINARAARFRQELLARLDARPRERGVRRARAVVMAATPWSQSVWETEARRLCLIGGITAPQPQMPVLTGIGRCFSMATARILPRGRRARCTTMISPVLSHGSRSGTERSSLPGA